MLLVSSVFFRKNAFFADLFTRQVALLVANFAQLPKPFKHWLLVRGYHNEYVTIIYDYGAYSR